MKATERQRLVVEVMGGVLVIAAFALIHIAMGVLVAGILLMIFANFYLRATETEEGTDAGDREHD